MNKVIIKGNLTRDPELRYTKSNTSVAEFGVAMNRKWKDREEVTFVDCTAWGNVGELIAKYIRKGRPILIEGRLTLDQWESKEGDNRSKLKVTVETFHFIDSKQEGDEQDEQATKPQQPVRMPKSKPASEPHRPVAEEDIPF